MGNHGENRPGGMLMSWDTFHIFLDRPSYLEIAHLPLAERVAALLEPERRDNILGEEIQSPLLKNGAQGRPRRDERYFSVRRSSTV